MIARDEALLVLDKLHSERSVVACVAKLPGWFLSLKGRISELSEREVGVTSLDGQARVAIRLDLPDLLFEYCEPKDFPIPDLPEADKHAVGLLIALPLRFSTADLEDTSCAPRRDKLFICELPSES